MNTNTSNWLSKEISELEQHHLDKSEKEFYESLNIDRTVIFSGVSFNKDDKGEKKPVFIDSCIFKGERKISEFIILLLLRSSSNVDWDYDVTLPFDMDNQNKEKMLHSWVVINDLIVCLYGSTIGRKLRNELIEWEKLGVEEVYISWYKNNLVELKSEALIEKYRPTLEKLETRNLKLINKLLEFADKDFHNNESLVGAYHGLTGYVRACNDHWDITDLDTEEVLTSIHEIYLLKGKYLI